jgi:hypothetical protein
MTLTISDVERGRDEGAGARVLLSRHPAEAHWDDRSGGFLDLARERTQSLYAGLLPSVSILAR